MSKLATIAPFLNPTQGGDSSQARDFCSWDLLVPVDFLALHRVNPARYPALLHSAAMNMLSAQFDILMAFPQGEPLVHEDFLSAFSRAWHESKKPRVMDPHVPPPSPLLPPFRGGWFVFLGYELIRQFEPRLRVLPAPPAGADAAWALRIPAALIRDHRTNSVRFICERGWERLVIDLADDLRRCVTQNLEPNFASNANLRDKLETTSWTIEEEAPHAYLDGVRRVKNYIQAGDVFQVNLSRCWRAYSTAPIDPLAIYQRLSQANPGPFAGFARLGNSYVLSSSPERLVKTTADRVETRPIAGTRPRGRDTAEDAQLRTALLANIKERAEHIMLIDLERNDLGRICIPGSICVDELMAIESYRHVHHIVSNVSGLMRAEVTPIDVIRAVFPGGTITGCPKIRCMEIIGEIEATGRGAYTGSMGYVNRDGDMDLNILIRTMVCDAGGVHFRAGAGIVADSNAEAELSETRAKARGLLAALGNNDAPTAAL